VALWIMPHADDLIAAILIWKRLSAFIDKSGV
jgi:hypothetical protein